VAVEPADGVPVVGSLLGHVRLFGLTVELVLIAVALVLVVLAAHRRGPSGGSGGSGATERPGGSARRGRSGRLLPAAVAVVMAFILAVGLNTELLAYPTLADLLGVSRYPSPGSVVVEDARENGAVADLPVPDTASRFGDFDAEVWLPPQYFTQPTTRFPVVILTHGNPGHSTDWLEGGDAGEVGLVVARGGQPVILVMPTVLQQPYGDSLCVNTTSQGNAETYVVQDVVAAVDTQLRTIPDAAHRTLGGFSMGGFCALNLGLKHPDVFSVALAFSPLTVCEPDEIDGGNEELFGTPDWEQRVADNSPADYYSSLDPARGPAVWLDAGDAESLAEPLETFGTELAAHGFTVQVHIRPGDHDFLTWTPALRQSLPWAAQRMGPPAP
jgi:S-formylglutathione hydrolase FrmB